MVNRIKGWGLGPISEIAQRKNDPRESSLWTQPHWFTSEPLAKGVNVWYGLEAQDLQSTLVSLQVRVKSQVITYFARRTRLAWLAASLNPTTAKNISPIGLIKCANKDKVFDLGITPASQEWVSNPGEQLSKEGTGFEF